MEKPKIDGYEFITTADGSVTAYSNAFGEACHSTAGAVQETWAHYIEGCQIQSSNHEVTKILEVGFGIGVGFFESLKAMQGRKFIFVSLEIDKKLIEWVKTHNKILQELSVNADGNFEMQNDQFHLLILAGDARATVPKFLNGLKFHAIYQDAFSPKRNPWLWTKEWFTQLYDLAADDCIMSTYSASSSIRKAMLAAGWNIKKGVQFGPKRSSTRATIAGESDGEILKHLERSGAPLLTDNIADSYKLTGKDNEKEQTH